MLLTNENCMDMKSGDCNIAYTYILVQAYKKPSGDGIIGAFRHLNMDEWISYTNISDFIYQLELLLEEINIPQATTCCRKSWGNKHPAPRNEVPIHLCDDPVWKTNQYGKISYLIHIRGRYYSSWQGSIKWLGKNKTINFRSVLELLMLLENGGLFDICKGNN